MTQQEQIVDGIIADYLETKFSGVKDKLSKTSKYFKRGAKASILGTDRKMYELIKTLEEKNSECDYLTYFDELVNAYREYVEVADCEVKTHGEVMTPIWLVEDMLNTLPSDVWSNPNLKWLDPCSGVGTYSSVVVQRLMKGLEDFEKNPTKRYRHIIEEMIYVCELQPKNMFIFQCVFDKDDTNELNTYCGSFLDEKFDNHMTDVWGVEKFDIVMGNPPYQTSNEGEKTQPIWDKFVLKSLSILSRNGYLNMVHPSGWRNIDGRFVEVKNEFKKRNLTFLSINDEKRGLEVFGAETRYDYYCLENTNNKGQTNIIFQDGSNEIVNISKLDFIPNGSIIDINNLIAKDGEDKVELLHSESNYAHRKPIMSKTQTNDFRYPCVYTINSNSEAKIWYSSTNEKGDFGKTKLIWSNGRISSIGSLIDNNGEYGLMEYASAIVDEPNNLPLLKKVFDSKEFKRLMELCSVGQLSINYKIIATFRKDFYKQFLND
jgi:hypothetical protein